MGTEHSGNQCAACLSSDVTITGDTAECNNCGTQYIKCNCCDEWKDADTAEYLDGNPFGEGATCEDCIMNSDHMIPRN